jgi:hypothetical protein
VVALIHESEWKANGCFGTIVECSQACELGLPLQGWNSIQKSSVSRGDWDCLIPLPHRVTRAILWWVILRYALKRLYLVWVVIGAYLEWINRISKLKVEIKDPLLVAFFAEIKPRTIISLHKSSYMAKYTMRRVSLASISILSLAS